MERAYRMRIDEGCDDGEGAVGRPLGDAEVSSSILSAAEAGDGATGFSNHEKQEENCEDHVQSVFDNFKVWDKKKKKNTRIKENRYIVKRKGKVNISRSRKGERQYMSIETRMATDGVTKEISGYRVQGNRRQEL